VTVFKYILVITFLVLPFLSGYAFERVLIIKNSLGREVSLHAEIADSDQKRAKGLMFRKELEANSGMLFVFPREQRMHFWMKNTYIPLSIAFIDRHGVIREIQHMKPLDESIIYSSKSKGLYALEVNQNWFRRNFIRVGSRILNIDGCIGK
jgi:hypothetical protein